MLVRFLEIFSKLDFSQMDIEIKKTMILLTASAIGVGFSMVGGVGPAIGTGYITGHASSALARYPESNSNVISTLVLGSAIAGTTGIYSLVIDLILMFANPLLNYIAQ